MRAASVLRDRFPQLDRLVRAAPMQRVIRSASRSAVFARPVRFVALELLARPDRCARHRLRDSAVHVILRHRSRDVEILDEIFVGRSIYEPPTDAAALLTDGLTVLDLGGNVGLFGAFILQRFPEAEVTSVEPDPGNAAVLERCIDANEGRNGRWRLIQACASSHLGQVWFEAGQYADSRIADAPSAETIGVRAIDVFPLMNSSDFVKMDIEGGEWPILLDPRFPTVTPAVIVLEWHRAGCPCDDSLSAAIAALRGAGYLTRSGPKNDYPYGVIWAWRAAPQPSSPPQ
jgi:FkbM family methyltransferase